MLVKVRNLGSTVFPGLSPELSLLCEDLGQWMRVGNPWLTLSPQLQSEFESHLDTMSLFPAERSPGADKIPDAGKKGF